MEFKQSYYSSTLALFFLVCITWHGQAQVTNMSTSKSYSTIQAAINDGTTVAGNLLQIDAGTFSENVTVNKSITLMGNGSATVITPSSGNGITITASTVSIYDLKITGASGFGIYASGVATILLSGVVCDANNLAAEVNNVSGFTASGCSFSNSNHHGFYSSSGQNFSFTNCTFNGNGKTIGDGSGLKIYSITGTSVFSNTTVSGNKYHGMEIRSGCSNITVNGGQFTSNGSSSTPGSDGGGIYIASYNGIAVSNITINGPLMASNNSTAGIYADAQSGVSDYINAITVGQSGVVTLTSNGITQGAGILLWGNIQNSSITANFSKGSVASSAGIIIIGRTDGSASPVNTVITNSTFNSGYSASTPAISLADQQPAQYKCVNGVTANGNTIIGTTTLADIDAVVYDHQDNAVLGSITWNGTVLPVELTSFDAAVSGREVHLHWSTATEVNNYGFEIERKKIAEQTVPVPSKTTSPPQASSARWLTLGFVMGSGTSNSPKEYSFTDSYCSPGEYTYRLRQIDNDGAFKYSGTKNVVIKLDTKFSLLNQNYPNPFNPATNISFALVQTEHAKLIVYTLIGQQVALLFNGIAEGEREYQVTFNASNLTSGIYFYSLQTATNIEVRKMQLIR